MPVTIFFCYVREDEVLLNKLKAHLKPLQREGLIAVWYDRDISAGTEWEREIRKHLNAAQIILLLVSPDFMNSDYCISHEMKRAVERHERKEARVIPIILDHVYWQVDPLNKLQVLPTDGKPVMGASWHSLNEALFNVTEGIRRVVEQLTVRHASVSPVIPIVKKYPSMIFCSQCGLQLASGTTSCPRCGAKTTQPEVSVTSYQLAHDMPIESRSSLLYPCFNCQGQNKPQVCYCTHCGYLLNQCTVCGNPNPVGNRFCIKCGHPLAAI